MILEVKYRITSLQSTAPERLDNKEGLKRDAWISLERGNRRDLPSGYVLNSRQCTVATKLHTGVK